MLANALTELGYGDILGPRDPVTLWMPSKHMGNLLVSLAAVERLESALPDNPCTLIVDASYRDILEAAGLRSEVLYFPRRAIDNAGIVGKAGMALDFIAATRRRRAKVAIAIEGDKVSQKFLPLSGCALSIGPDNRHCRRFTLKLPMRHNHRHVFYDYEAVARQLTGAPVSPGYVGLKPTEDSLARVKTRLTRELPDPDRPFGVFHPCATKGYKQWPGEYFAALADFVNESGTQVVLTGAGSFDGDTIARLKSHLRTPAVSLHDQLSIGEFIALLHSAAFYIGNDTGPTHLAAACAIPCFAIFGPTDEHLWGPLGDNAHIVRSDTPCEPECLRRRCAVDYRCITSLKPETVMARLEPLL